MNTASPIHAYPSLKYRRAGASDQPIIFTDIYSEETNIAIWQRELSKPLQNSIRNFLNSNKTLQMAMAVTPESAAFCVSESLRDADCQQELSENIAELVDMFCCLFDIKRAGLRLTTLDQPMCPRFHIDRIPCRLVTSYSGTGTEWLPHSAVNREKLGTGNQGKLDHESGLFQHPSDIQQLNPGDVALLKGELWEGNENAALVHRSPSMLAGERRILLTLDMLPD